jgi:ABC-type sulfate transport system permease subunit
LLAVLALITLSVKTLLEWKQARDYARAQAAESGMAGQTQETA